VLPPKRLAEERGQAVSQGDLEVVRGGLDLRRESFKRGAATDGLLGLCGPDIRLDATRRVFNPDVYEGDAGMRRSIQEICDAWEEFQASKERLIDAGDRIVVIWTISGRARASKAHVQQRGALIWTVREDLVQLIEVFTDPREALKALGLCRTDQVKGSGRFFLLCAISDKPGGGDHGARQETPE
jgi:ketosteroid isomerase-like protein